MLVFVSVCVYNNILRITTCFYKKNSTFQVVYLRQSTTSGVMQICIKFASHHLLLYVDYMCQKSLNFTYAFKCYQQNVSGFTLAGPPCTYIHKKYLYRAYYPNSKSLYALRSLNKKVFSSRLKVANGSPGCRIDDGSPRFQRQTVRVEVRTGAIVKNSGIL